MKYEINYCFKDNDGYWSETISKRFRSWVKVEELLNELQEEELEKQLSYDIYNLKTQELEATNF